MKRPFRNKYWPLRSRSALAGMGHIAPQARRVRLRFDPDQPVGQVGAEEQLEPLEHLVGRRELVDHPLVVSQDGGQTRTSQRDSRELLADMAELGRDRTQKLSPHGRVEKQIPHFDHGSAGHSARLNGRHRAAVDGNLGAVLAIGLAALDFEPADRRDRRQRLAAKAHRADAKQIVGPANFARGMARDGQRQVVGVNSLAVVRDANELGAPVDDLDIDAGGQGIEAVLQEFLDDAARAFDDLTGGDLVDDEGLESLESAT